MFYLYTFYKIHNFYPSIVKFGYFALVTTLIILKIVFQPKVSWFLIMGPFFVYFLLTV